MNAQHFDVLVIGAGLSGIGTSGQVGPAQPNKTLATQTSAVHTLPRKVATK
jgi:cation diffusion facilitator CzcD-associated flavoprotein CzcO